MSSSQKSGRSCFPPRTKVDQELKNGDVALVVDTENVESNKLLEKLEQRFPGHPPNTNRVKPTDRFKLVTDEGCDQWTLCNVAESACRGAKFNYVMRPLKEKKILKDRV